MRMLHEIQRHTDRWPCRPSTGNSSWSHRSAISDLVHVPFPAIQLSWAFHGLPLWQIWLCLSRNFCSTTFSPVSFSPGPFNYYCSKYRAKQAARLTHCSRGNGTEHLETNWSMWVQHVILRRISLAHEEWNDDDSLRTSVDRPLYAHQFHQKSYATTVQCFPSQILAALNSVFSPISCKRKKHNFDMKSIVTYDD